MSCNTSSTKKKLNLHIFKILLLERWAYCTKNLLCRVEVYNNSKIRPLHRSNSIIETPCLNREYNMLCNLEK